GSFEERGGRGERFAGRRPRGDVRPREDQTPVAHAAGAREGVAAIPGREPQRHADFITWQPPEEEGDDEPILGADEPRRPESARRDQPDARRAEARPPREPRE